MTPDQRFAVLLAILVALMGGLGWLVKTLLGVITQWARTGERLERTGEKIEELSTDIRDLVANKERDHDRLGGRIDRLDDRVTVHERWHSEH